MDELELKQLLNQILERLENIETKLEEIDERISNISTPGVDYGVYD